MASKSTKNVEFSITAATSGLERIVTGIAGDGLGAVHQFITQEAYNSDPTLDQRMVALGKRNCSASQLIAGVIWNDFPLDSVDPERTEAYAAGALEAFDQKYAPYLTDPRFRVQPKEGLRVAMGAVHKGVPDIVSIMVGVNAQYVVIARRMIRERINEDRPHRHFMRKTASEGDAAVIAGAIYICLRWMAMALFNETAFYLGNITHTIEDSFSAAHTKRSAPSDSAPYGAVNEVYFFGNQSDHSHSSAESWREVTRRGSDASRRVAWLIAPLREVFSFFITSMETLNSQNFSTPDERKAGIDNLMPAFAAMLADRIFLHSAMSIRSQSRRLSDAVLLPRTASPVSAPDALEPRSAASAALPARESSYGEDSQTESDSDASGASDSEDGSEDTSSSSSSNTSAATSASSSSSSPVVEDVDGEVKKMKKVGRRRGRGWGGGYRRGRGRGWGAGAGLGLGLGLGAGALLGATAVAPYGLYRPRYYDPYYYDPLYVRPRTVYVQPPPPQQVTYVTPGVSSTTTTTYTNSQIGAEQLRIEASRAARQRRRQRQAERRAQMEQAYRPDEGDMIRVRVLGVHDGDTVRVQPLVRPDDPAQMVLPLSIRLMRIDAPELKQPGGKEARRALKTLLGARHKAQPEVWLRAEGRDRYFRTLGTLFVGDDLNVNGEMVRLGFAHYYPYDKQSISPEFEAYERDARRRRLELWSGQVDPELPSHFRKRVKAERKAANKKRGYALWYEEDTPIESYQKKPPRFPTSEGSRYPGRA